MDEHLDERWTSDLPLGSNTDPTKEPVIEPGPGVVPMHPGVIPEEFPNHDPVPGEVPQPIHEPVPFEIPGPIPQPIHEPVR